ncbi:MAG: O-antigen ligase family protein [Cytophagales bacterium]
MNFSDQIKNTEYRNELFIKLILLFLFLMINPKALTLLPEPLQTVYPKIFKNSTISLMVILLIGNWAFDKNILQKLKNGIQNPFFIIAFSYWFLHVVGILYSHNTREANFVVEKKLSLIIFPLIFTSINLSETSKLNIMQWFVVLVFISSILSICFGLYNYSLTHDIQSIMLENSLIIDIHRVVMSMYLTLGAYFVFELHKQKRISLYHLITYMALATIHIFLLASRLYLVTFVVWVYYLFYTYIIHKKIFWAVSVSGVFVVLVSGFALFKCSKSFKSQVETVFMPRQNNASNTNGVSERKYQWDAATTLIKKHPFTGVGQGDVEDSLINQYKKMNWQIGVIHKYHAHNQYLQSFIALGLGGVITLLALIFYPFLPIRKTSTESKMCAVLFAIAMLTDNHTEIQQSVVFMFLWLSLFLNLKKTDNYEHST